MLASCIRESGCRRACSCVRRQHQTRRTSPRRSCWHVVRLGSRWKFCDRIDPIGVRGRRRSHETPLINAARWLFRLEGAPCCGYDITSSKISQYLGQYAFVLPADVPYVGIREARPWLVTNRLGDVVSLEANIHPLEGAAESHGKLPHNTLLFEPMCRPPPSTPCLRVQIQRLSSEFLQDVVRGSKFHGTLSLHDIVSMNLPRDGPLTRRAPTHNHNCVSNSTNMLLRKLQLVINCSRLDATLGFWKTGAFATAMECQCPLFQVSCTPDRLATQIHSRHRIVRVMCA